MYIAAAAAAAGCNNFDQIYVGELIIIMSRSSLIRCPRLILMMRMRMMMIDLSILLIICFETTSIRVMMLFGMKEGRMACSGSFFFFVCSSSSSLIFNYRITSSVGIRDYSHTHSLSLPWLLSHSRAHSREPLCACVCVDGKSVLLNLTSSIRLLSHGTTGRERERKEIGTQ